MSSPPASPLPATPSPNVALPLLSTASSPLPSQPKSTTNTTPTPTIPQSSSICQGPAVSEPEPDPEPNDQADADTDPVTAQPKKQVSRRRRVAVNGSGGKRRVALPALLAYAVTQSPDDWIAKGCCIAPLGSCQQQPLGGSLYCVFHSCRAVNADGSLCFNAVPDPAQSRFCAVGWHMETSRSTPVDELVARRQQHEQLAALARPYELYELTTFYERNFSNPSATSNTSTNSSSSSSSLSSSLHRSHPVPIAGRRQEPGVPLPPAMLPQHRSASTGSGDINGRDRTTPKQVEERGWGAHGVDKWWVGEWNRNQLRSTR